MATTGIYGKLGKPELGGGKLVVQAGVVDFAASATLKMSIASSMKKILFAGFTPLKESGGGGAAGKIGAPFLATATITTTAVIATRLSAGCLKYTYCLIGY